MKRICHIDDCALWADEVKRCTNIHHELRHCGWARTITDGWALCCEHKPDVLVLDVQLGGEDGWCLVERLASVGVRPAIFMITSKTDEFSLVRAFRHPAWTILEKSIHTGADLSSAFGAWIGGRPSIPREVLQRISRYMAAPDAIHKIFTNRELSLMSAFSQGLRDSIISQRFGISPETIHSHRTRVMAKVGAHSAADLMRWARDRGFGEDSSGFSPGAARHLDSPARLARAKA